MAAEHDVGIREIIRLAIIDHPNSRDGLLLQISKCLNCDRDVAKELFYAFLYNAEDRFLNNKLRSA